jgi:hypothetical protein
MIQSALCHRIMCLGFFLDPLLKNLPHPEHKDFALLDAAGKSLSLTDCGVDQMAHIMHEICVSGTLNKKITIKAKESKKKLGRDRDDGRGEEQRL